MTSWDAEHLRAGGVLSPNLLRFLFLTSPPLHLSQSRKPQYQKCLSFAPHPQLAITLFIYEFGHRNHIMRMKSKDQVYMTQRCRCFQSIIHSLIILIVRHYTQAFTILVLLFIQFKSFFLSPKKNNLFSKCSAKSSALLPLSSQCSQPQLPSRLALGIPPSSHVHAQLAPTWLTLPPGE